MNLIKSIFYRQYIWVAMASLVLALYFYGEITATRLFGGTSPQQWKPQGANSHNNITHK